MNTLIPRDTRSIDLAKWYESNLPTMPIEEVVEVKQLSQRNLDVIRAAVNRARVQGLHDVVDKGVETGQVWAELVLRARGRIGDELIEHGTPEGQDRHSSEAKEAIKLGLELEPERNQRDRDRVVARNPEVVEEVIEEARENKDFASMSAVESKVRLKKAEKALDEIKKGEGVKKPKARPLIDEVVQSCIDNILDVNIVIEDILDNTDSVNPGKLISLYEALRRLYQILSERHEEWKREESIQPLLK